MSPRVIDFYFDVVCPYAYLASTRIEALQRAWGVQMRWRPVLLGGLLRHHGGPDDPNATMSAPRAALNRADLLRFADLWQCPLHVPPEHPRRSVEAMRALVVCSDGARPALARRLFEAYWVHGRDPSAPEVLASLAREHGVDPEQWQSQQARDDLREATARAAAAGVFGVPTFVIEQTLVWGQDRLALLEHVAAGETVDPSRGWAPPRTDAGPVDRIEFFHDFASPFSYLASTQIERIAAEYGVPVQWRPILLGALFREVGTADVPLHTMHAAKQAWVRRDLHQWASLWGVPFRFPSHFPMRTVLPLRVSLAESRAQAALYKAAWADDRRIDEPEACKAVLDDAGLDGAGLVEQASDPAIKLALRENTAAAQAAGACGVPSMQIHREGHRPTLLWGQDRLGMLRAALQGWAPPSV